MQAVSKILNKANNAPTRKWTALYEYCRGLFIFSVMIIRTNKENGGFTQVDNRYVRDKKLSLSAKGLLTYMLSQPNDWYFSAQKLEEETNTKRARLETILNELEEKGYLTRERTRENGRLGKMKFIVYEESIVDSPRIVFEEIDGESPFPI